MIERIKQRINLITQSEWMQVLLLAGLCCVFPGSAKGAIASPEPTEVLVVGTPSDSVAAWMRRGHLNAAPDGRGGVEKGPIFTIGKVDLISRQGFTRGELNLSRYIGRPADSAHVAEVTGSIKDFLLNHGYPFAVVDLILEEIPASPTLIAIRAEIHSGFGYKFGGLKYSGTKTTSKTLDKLGLLAFGEDYSEMRLRLARGKLARTGYFEEISEGPLFRDSVRNLLYPSLHISDYRGNRISGILGYDSENKDQYGRGEAASVTGFLDINLINMRGTARDLEFQFTTISVRQREFTLAYTEPWIHMLPLGATVEGLVSLQDSVSGVSAGYNERKAGLIVFQDINFHSRYRVAFERQWNESFGLGTPILSRAYITGMEIIHDTRDAVPFTMRGIRTSNRVNAIRRTLDDSAYFLAQSMNELRLWHGLGARWVGHARLSGAGNWPLDASSNRGDLFTLGGANSVRGFREREFLTNLYLYANMEMQYLLSRGNRLVAFAVPAFINRDNGGIHWRRVLGYGIGMDLGSRHWVFGLSYALNSSRDLGDGYLHLRVDNNF